MEHLDYNVIGSSSKGNCIIVENKIMLDCGVAYSKVKKYLKDIKVIFISHIHKDHLLQRTIRTIAYEKPNIKFICGNKIVSKQLVWSGVQLKNIIILEKDKWFDLGMIKCMVQDLHHDTPNSCLHLEIRNLKMLYAVDTEYIDDIKAKNYDTYLVEGNYEEDLLEENRKIYDENFQFDYLYRVEKTHLSVRQAMNFIIENMGDNSQYQLIHQSELNTRKKE